VPIIPSPWRGAVTGGNATLHTGSGLLATAHDILDEPDYDALVAFAPAVQTPPAAPAQEIQGSNGPIAQEVQAPVYAQNSPLQLPVVYVNIGQMPQSQETNPHYNQYSETTVTATQNIQTTNNVSIVQICNGGGCTQTANPNTSATTTAGQTINASSGNVENVFQSNTSTGSGSTMQSAGGPQSASTNVQATENAGSANTTQVLQSADGSGATTQSAATQSTATTDANSTINAGSQNTSNIVQTAQ
jgi:hypothetical protein